MEKESTNPSNTKPTKSDLHAKRQEMRLRGLFSRFAAELDRKNYAFQTLGFVSGGTISSL